MPKQSYIIRDWSGGINNRKDPRDIIENEFSHISNMSIDSLGKVKTVGGLYEANADSDGDTSSSPLQNYIVTRVASIVGSGGYNAFYFESDHSRSSDNSIDEAKSGVNLAIGTAVGNISFTNVNSKADIPDAGAEYSGL